MKRILFTFAIILVSSFAIFAQKDEKPKPTPKPSPPPVINVPKKPKPDKPSSSPEVVDTNYNRKYDE